MNSYQFQFQKSYERELSHIFLQATYGSSGAVTISPVTNRGVASIVKQSTAGQYLITLRYASNRLMSVENCQIAASGSPAAPDLFVISADVQSAKTILVQFTAADGSTATNPASGETSMMHIVLCDVPATN